MSEKARKRNECVACDQWKRSAPWTYIALCFLEHFLPKKIGGNNAIIEVVSTASFEDWGRTFVEFNAKWGGRGSSSSSSSRDNLKQVSYCTKFKGAGKSETTSRPRTASKGDKDCSFRIDSCVKLPKHSFKAGSSYTASTHLRGQGKWRAQQAQQRQQWTSFLLDCLVLSVRDKLDVNEVSKLDENWSESLKI